MAMPINPTPRLNHEESERFLEMVAKNLDRPSCRKADPAKLEIARQRAREHALSRRQHP
jgi:hypothetical protein